MALTEEMKAELDGWMEVQRIELSSIMCSQVQQAVTTALAKRQRQPPWWRLAWLWLCGLVWKHNPVRVLARRRHAARDVEAQWEHIGCLLTKR
jgi:hypothetical protein